MDSLDEQLIELLEKDARQSSDKLAKLLHVSDTTIRRRLRQLIANNTLRIVALVDPDKVGYPLVACLVFNVEHGKLDSVTRELSSQPSIKWLSMATGRFDILSTALFRSTSELNDFVQRKLPAIQGITHTETFICLEVKKGRYFAR